MLSVLSCNLKKQELEMPKNQFEKQSNKLVKTNNARPIIG